MSGQWVRGVWNVGFSADAPAGVCQAYVAVDGTAITSAAVQQPVQTAWRQCGPEAGSSSWSGPVSVTKTIDTTQLGSGMHTLEYYAADAASPANVAAPTYSVGVDNEPVSVDVAGPASDDTGAPVAVTVTAAAGPSGIADIRCLVNNTWRTYTQARVAIDLQAQGENVVSCYAENNAVDAVGDHARSPQQEYTIDIRRPTASLLALAHVADALRCVRRLERVRVPAHTVVVRDHGQRVRVRIPAQRRVVRVRRCHPRVRVVRVHRRGRTMVRRIVMLPHAVDVRRERIRFDGRAVITGWLGSPNGDALSGAPIEITAAPLDGAGAFVPVKTVTTNANGTWTATLPAGPSRLVEATYPGTAVLAPSTSRPVLVSVPAAPVLAVAPRQTAWGRRITISGHLRGGYIPSSGELVVLRIGWGSGFAEIGHVYTNASGVFRTRYTFLRGSGSETYRIWATTVRESGYPYAPGRSRDVTVHVR